MCLKMHSKNNIYHYNGNTFTYSSIYKSYVNNYKYILQLLGNNNMPYCLCVQVIMLIALYKLRKCYVTFLIITTYILSVNDGAL